MKKNLFHVSGGYLVQDKDNFEVAKRRYESCYDKAPTDDQWDAMLWLESNPFCKSNAVILSNTEQTVGIGAGQMNRVGSAKLR